MTNDVRARLVAIFADVFQTEVEGGADVQREALDAWDSVNHFRLVMEIEQVFDVTLSDDEVTDLESLAQVEALIARKLGSEGAA